jgi:hypothetical protein
MSSLLHRLLARLEHAVVPRYHRLALCIRWHFRPGLLLELVRLGGVADLVARESDAIEHAFPPGHGGVVHDAAGLQALHHAALFEMPRAGGVAEDGNLADLEAVHRVSRSRRAEQGADYKGGRCGREASWLLYELSDFADPAVREAWIRYKGMLVFQMYNAQARMSDDLNPPAGSFEAAELFHLRTALESTPQQRLQDLQDMIDFNAEAEARNPHLRRIAELLRKP